MLVLFLKETLCSPGVLACFRDEDKVGFRKFLENSGLPLVNKICCLLPVGGGMDLAGVDKVGVFKLDGLDGVQLRALFNELCNFFGVMLEAPLLSFNGVKLMFRFWKRSVRTLGVFSSSIDSSIVVAKSRF